MAAVAAEEISPWFLKELFDQLASITPGSVDLSVVASPILTIFLLSRRRHVDHRHFQPQPAAFVRPKKKRKKAKK